MLFAVLLLQAASEPTPGVTWATAGIEHELFACRDLDGDGFDEIVVATEQKSLLASASVHGWKAAPWRAIDVATWPGGFDGFLVAAGTPFETTRVPTPPPYEPDAKLVRVFGGDLDGDQAIDAVAVFRCTRPHDFLELRVAFGPRTSGDDQDGDGLPDSQEIAIGTDRFDRDSDDDGLLDGWEVIGLPRDVAIGAATELDPRRQDAIVAIAPFEGVDAAALPAELERAARIYRALPTHNRDGSTGVWLHFRVDPIVPTPEQAGGDWAKVGEARFKKSERGLLHWMQITPGAGGQSQQTGDMGGAGASFATFAHELGHQLSLGHAGDSVPNWCPLYPSLMNYAFNYALGGDAEAIRFSTGRFRGVELRESALIEKLPFAHADVAYLAAPPFRFTLRENGPGETLIDWNHDGSFDERPVVADVNYGGSTHCGARKPMELVGAAPALAYVGATCWLATLDPAESSVSLRGHLGDGRWSEPRKAPGSATGEDPLLVGAGEDAWILLRRPSGWFASRFDASAIEEPFLLADLPNVALSAATIAGRALLVAREDDDSLAIYKLERRERGAGATRLQELELRSKVPVGIAEEPGTGRVAVASAMTNSRGAPLCMRVTWYRVVGERWVEEETKWVRGEASGTSCTTRPSIVFDADRQLNVFHTGMPDRDGRMTVSRTRRVGNASLDEGWLSCLLYDVWTSTRRGVSVAAGPQGAIYAFRWDAGDVHEWRTNQLVLAHDAFGIDLEPMRDFDDGERIARHGVAHSILWMQPDSAQAQ